MTFCKEIYKFIVKFFEQAQIKLFLTPSLLMSDYNVKSNLYFVKHFSL